MPFSWLRFSFEGPIVDDNSSYAVSLNFDRDQKKYGKGQPTGHLVVVMGDGDGEVNLNPNVSGPTSYFRLAYVT